MGMGGYCWVVFSCETHELDWGRSGEEFSVPQSVPCIIYTRTHTREYKCSYIFIWRHSTNFHKYCENERKFMKSRKCFKKCFQKKSMMQLIWWSDVTLTCMFLIILKCDVTSLSNRQGWRHRQIYVNHLICDAMVELTWRHIQWYLKVKERKKNSMKLEKSPIVPNMLEKFNSSMIPNTQCCWTFMNTISIYSSLLKWLWLDPAIQMPMQSNRVIKDCYQRWMDTGWYSLILYRKITSGRYRMTHY